MADYPHPWYGPCDAFGPNDSCAECSGWIARDDGTCIPTHPCDGPCRGNPVGSACLHEGCPNRALHSGANSPAEG